MPESQDEADLPTLAAVPRGASGVETPIAPPILHGEDLAHVVPSLRGKTLEWTFLDGPAKGETFVHRVNIDGSADVRTGKDREWRRLQACACTRVGNYVHVISYMDEGGDTLTAVLNTRSGQVVAFVSNASQWHPQHGTFRFMDAEAKGRGSRLRRTQRRSA